MAILEGIGSALGIGPGALFTGLTSLFGGAARNISQEQQAANQQSFQERMSSTAYQRAMQDMREAGLNPMLAAKVGPASTPGGAMANIQDIGTPAVQAATSAYQAETQRRQQEQQGDLIEVQVDKVAVDMGVSRERAREIGEHINLMMQQRMSETERGNLIRQQIEKLRNEVGTQAAIRFLKELEADAYANMDKNVFNPYTGRLVAEFANAGVKALSSLIAPAVVGRAIRAGQKGNVKRGVSKGNAK
jgi:hypothetical protein